MLYYYPKLIIGTLLKYKDSCTLTGVLSDCIPNSSNLCELLCNVGKTWCEFLQYLLYIFFV